MHTTAPFPRAAAVPAPDWRELATHRSALLGFARRRIYDPALAEDAVHDVFEAVLSGRATFVGRSALRTWLVGILKNKIVDLVRERAGEERLTVEEGGDDVEWASPDPRPDEVAEQRERLARTLKRIDRLPQGLRDVMIRRILHEESTHDVCNALGITEENLFVRVFRARRHLLS